MRRSCGLGMLLAVALAPAVAQADDFTPTTGSMGSVRAYHTATLLQSGSVLVTGGLDASSRPVASAEVFDPATGGFTPTAGPMGSARYFHTATPLGSGKVLIAGGLNTSFAPVASAELFDPATGHFTPTSGPMGSVRDGQSATLLASGKVLIAGGQVTSGYTASAELFDPATGQFAPTAGPMGSPRAFQTATLLGSGEVLIAGGVNQSGALASAELFDPATGHFTPTAGPMAGARYIHTATLLGSGKVLITGGVSDGSVTASAELFDPATGAFTPTSGAMNSARFGHTATLLASNEVLLTGGFDEAFAPTASAELYASPPSFALVPTKTVADTGTRVDVDGHLYDGSGVGLAGKHVLVSIVSGPNAGKHWTKTSESVNAGHFRFGLVSTKPTLGTGTDVFEACYDADASETCDMDEVTDTTSVEWVAARRMIVVSAAIAPADPGNKVTLKGTSLYCESSHFPLKATVIYSTKKNVVLHTFAMTLPTGRLCDTPSGAFTSITGTGDGTLDGAPGYTFSYTLTDQGEPGKTAGDTMAIAVKDSGDQTVFAASGPITSGELDAYSVSP